MGWFSRKKPIGEAFGNIKIGGVLGASDKQFIKELKTMLPALTSKEEKAILKYMKNIESDRIDTSFLRVAVDKTTYEKVYRNKLPRFKYLTYLPGSSRMCCNKGWAEGCCDGPDVSGPEGLDKSYYIMEYTGNKEFSG